MHTVLVSGPAPERARLAEKITELFATMGKAVLHYPKVDLRPATFPEGLEVAVLETSSTPERIRG